MNLTEKFLQFALLGANWVLWLLIILSIASFAIIIERLIFFMGLRGADLRIVGSLNEALAKGDKKGALAIAEKEDSPGARIVQTILRRGELGIEAARSLVEASRPAERLRLERSVSFLGTVGANAPFIGLFGTVLEILRVFNLLGAKGVTSASETAGIMTGISEALVATAIGLLVAIPAVIAYNALQRRIKRLMGEADALINMSIAQLQELERLGHKSAAGASPSQGGGKTGSSKKDGSDKAAAAKNSDAED